MRSIVRLLVCTALVMLMVVPAFGMGDNMIGQVFDQIQQRITDAWDWLWDPLWGWYVMLILFFLLLLVIGFFVPFKWVRAFLGFLLALAAAFVAGGHVMRNKYKERLAEEREKVKQLEARRRQEGQSGGRQGGGFWPFN